MRSHFGGEKKRADSRRIATGDLEGPREKLFTGKTFKTQGKKKRPSSRRSNQVKKSPAKAKYKKMKEVRALGRQAIKGKEGGDKGGQLFVRQNEKVAWKAQKRPAKTFGSTRGGRRRRVRKETQGEWFSAGSTMVFGEEGKDRTSEGGGQSRERSSKGRESIPAGFVTAKKKSKGNLER